MEKILQIIARELNIGYQQAAAAVNLLDDGNTVPFIARYRKEATGSLDEEQLRNIEERLGYLRNLEARRQEIISAIAAQEKLTPELEQTLLAAEKLWKTCICPIAPTAVPARSLPGKKVWRSWQKS